VPGDSEGSRICDLEVVLGEAHPLMELGPSFPSQEQVCRRLVLQVEDMVLLLISLFYHLSIPPSLLLQTPFLYKVVLRLFTSQHLQTCVYVAHLRM
jgi:hypothetical protein